MPISDWLHCLPCSWETSNTEAQEQHPFMSSRPLRQVPRDVLYRSRTSFSDHSTYSAAQLETLASQESALTLPHFNANDAFTLGVSIRSRLRELSTKPAVVNISLVNNNQLLFHAASRSGIVPDNDIWVARKRKTVLRFGVSSWMMHNKMKGDEKAFAEKFSLGPNAGDYAIHGGGVPVRVHGVEGVVAVVVVSGLKQEEDHQVVIEAMEEFLKSSRPS